MSAHRTTISINKDLYEAGVQVMKDRFFDNFSEYVASLVRDDVEAAKLRSKSATLTSVLAEEPAKYGNKKVG